MERRYFLKGACRICLLGTAGAHRRADKAEAVGADVASTIKDAQRRAVEAEARVVKLTHTLETKVAELEAGVSRVFAGGLESIELSTLDVDAGGERFVAVNDAVVTSGELGRMVELEWSVGGEDFGRVPCDGLICSTPSGSTAYNLSNGGPVLMWGLDAMALTFVAPHDLRARPFVVPRGRDLEVWNRTPEVGCAVLVDGHRVGEAGRDAKVSIRLGEKRSLLGTLPEATFVRRYRQSFGLAPA